MYDFIDRDVGRLSRGGQLMIWAMRAWVRASASRQCPSTAVGPAFLKWHCIDALSHFNMAMVILNHHALEAVGFGPLPCRHVREGEALLLAIMRNMARGASIDTRKTITLMTEANWVGPLHSALEALSRHLLAAGLIPDITDAALPAQENEE